MVEQLAFHDKNGKEVTQKRYDKLIPSFKGPIDTLCSPGADWSPWSRAYDGRSSPFLSPVPRRYLQLQTAFFSEDPLQAVRLDEIALEFVDPLATATRGEIYPVAVRPGEATVFTYYIRPDFARGDAGFDQLLLTSSAAIKFSALRIDGATAQATDLGARLDLGRTVRRAGLLEIDFESTIFANQTRLDAFLLNTAGDAEIRQQVDPGNADATIASGAISVALPAQVPILNNLALSSAFLTPNGDDTNDELRLSLNVLRLLSPRVLRAEVLDLSGRRQCLLVNAPVIAGRVEIAWDGRDDGNAPVAPGLYLLRLEVGGDAETARIARVVSVAY